MKNIFKRKVELISTNDLKMVIIETETENYHKTLGITDERMDELMEVVREVVGRGDMGQAECMVECSKIAKHPNELGVMCFILGEIFHQFLQQKKAMDMMGKIFGKE